MDVTDYMRLQPQKFSDNKQNKLYFLWQTIIPVESTKCLPLLFKSYSHLHKRCEPQYFYYHLVSYYLAWLFSFMFEFLHVWYFYFRSVILHVRLFAGNVQCWHWTATHSLRNAEKIFKVSIKLFKVWTNAFKMHQSR